MKNIILSFVICFCSLQAFTKNDRFSEETLEESKKGMESLSNAWSSGENTEARIESDKDEENVDPVKADISSSEESSEENYEFAKNTEVEKEEKNKNTRYAIDKSSESQKEPSNVIWTYVLVSKCVAVWLYLLI